MQTRVREPGMNVRSCSCGIYRPACHRLERCAECLDTRERFTFMSDRLHLRKRGCPGRDITAGVSTGVAERRRRAP